MADDLVTIEVDGTSLKARKGAMLIEATDAAGIYVPRFCYHHRLTIAANCRMCLVEVEKAPKPLPACATPIMGGMKVKTRSPLALGAQRSTMEFLLINHPLDCPICDQGGECELQDLAMGFGSDVSRYVEGKRVVRDKDIGPLIQTDMTRCIHCTRCVRFGEEIAGMRELGATGRGEHMEIGTYIAQAVGSELSGNVIDLCPVGALTSKPYRYSARAWELRQFPAIAAHDAVGSNVHLHVKAGRVKRVVPGENDAVNESWISDRDRYSYEGLYHPQRLTAPMLKSGGTWREVEWDTALAAAVTGLRGVATTHGGEALGVLASPNATLEEHYLLARFARGLGTANVDHRLRQGDFRDQDAAPVAAWLGCAIADLERIDAALIIGGNPRKDQPLINHRLRKATLRGARVALLNAVDFDFNWAVAAKAITAPSQWPATLAGIAKALIAGTDDADARLLQAATAGEEAVAIAALLKSATNAVVLLGPGAIAHLQFSVLRWLAGVVARASGARIGYLTEGANGVGAELAGVVPHRGANGAAAARAGLDARAMFDAPRRGYLLLGVEPEHDCWDPLAATRALRAAEWVVSLTAYRTPGIDAYAHLMLPIAQFAETDGTYVNAACAWQQFAAAVAPPGNARAAWKILRVLGASANVAGFTYDSVDDIRAGLTRELTVSAPELMQRWRAPARLVLAAPGGVERVTVMAPYSVDALVRRAPALQLTADAADARARVGTALARRLGIYAGAMVTLMQGDARVRTEAAIDPGIADGCVHLHAAAASAVTLGPWSGLLEIAPG